MNKFSDGQRVWVKSTEASRTNMPEMLNVAMIVNYNRSIKDWSGTGYKIVAYRTYDEYEPENFHFFNEDELDTFPSIVYDNAVGEQLRKEVSLD